MGDVLELFRKVAKQKPEWLPSVEQRETSVQGAIVRLIFWQRQNLKKRIPHLASVSRSARQLRRVCLRQPQRSPCRSVQPMQNQTKQDTPEPHIIALPNHTYQRSVTAFNEGMRVRASFEEQSKLGLQSVKIRYVIPRKRKP